MESTLRALEELWARSLQSMDIAALEKLLAPEFRLSFVNDPRAPRTVPREDWFAILPRMSFGAFSILRSEERLFGDVGVFHMQCRFEDWTLDGKTLPAEYEVTDVFIRRGGEWMVMNRISAPVADAPKFWD